MDDAEISAILRRLDVSERNHTDLARSVTSLTETLNEVQRPLIELNIDREVRKERDKNLNERLDRIESKIKESTAETKAEITKITGLGYWVLGAIGAAFVTGAVTFVMNGGLRVGS